MANFEQFGSRIPDAESVRRIFLTTQQYIFIFQKLKTELKNL